VSDRYANTPDFIDLMITLYMHVWKFRRWTTSRFLQTGACGRQMLFSLLLGLEPIVTYALANGESSYYIGGVNRYMSAKVKAFTVQTALCSRISDEPLLMMMKDDRLPLQLPKVDAAMVKSLEQIQAISDDARAFFGHVVAMDACELRDSCCKGALAAAGYVGMHLRHARRKVWALLQGDRNANLFAFAAGPQPDNESSTLFRIWTLMQQGEVDICLQGLELLALASWTTLNEEEAHAVASGLMRGHRQYGSPMLQSRSQVIQFQPLLSVDPLEARLARLSGQILRVDTRNPNYFTGRQLFVRELNFEVQEQRLSGRTLGSHIHETILARHGSRWAGMTENQRRSYDERAVDARVETVTANAAKRVVLTSEVQKLEKQIADAAVQSKPVRLSACKLNAVDKISIQAFWEQERFSALNVMPQINSNGMTLKVPNDLVRQVLEKVNIDTDPKSCTPAWVKLMCFNRVFFSGCVIQVHEPGDNDEERIYKFAFAMQSPYVVCLASLVRNDSIML
jgi:hypothetical protein